MSRQVVSIQNLTIAFPHKVCLENFCQSVQFGDRIALMGPNGSGKSSLLRSLAGECAVAGGVIRVAEDIVLAAVPQILGAGDGLSGGERFNRALTAALSRGPNLLLLDEPTNHLDVNNRRSLMNLLDRFRGTIIFASHDEELLERCGEIFWHLENGVAHVFCGSYGNYRRSLEEKRHALEQEIARLGKKRNELVKKLQAEQIRAKRSRAVGRRNQAKAKVDKMTAFALSQRAERSGGKNLRALADERRELAEKLSKIQLPQVIVPTFHLSGNRGENGPVLTILDGAVAYGEKKVLEGIRLTLFAGERMAIAGKNGGGKTTLLRAIAGDPSVSCRGRWDIPASIGYLDQDYGTIALEKSPLENLRAIVPHWSVRELRRHLQCFLFRKDGEVSLPANRLSGGERARLALAIVAARVPRLLILDEVTNNVDNVTRRHIAEVIKEFPAAILAVSHDEKFLSAAGIGQFFELPAATG
ncbi:MAG: ATP-binding cassette domain-containing protein [Puniceicoccales bacterium]|nr:ATP-binding cassette domain-containing protein [Puniceicoccales bacterium]